MQAFGSKRTGPSSFCIRFVSYPVKNSQLSTWDLKSNALPLTAVMLIKGNGFPSFLPCLCSEWYYNARKAATLCLMSEGIVGQGTKGWWWVKIKNQLNHFPQQSFQDSIISGSWHSSNRGEWLSFALKGSYWVLFWALPKTHFVPIL